jgi:hypothetical protein
VNDWDLEVLTPVVVFVLQDAEFQNDPVDFARIGRWVTL